MEKVILSIWPPVILLAILWTMLALIYFYVRYQLKKEKKLLDEIEVPLENKDAFLIEIDALASYVSRLPRSKEILQEYRNKDNDSEN